MVIIGKIGVTKFEKLSPEELAEAQADWEVQKLLDNDVQTPPEYKEVESEVRGVLDTDAGYIYYELEDGVRVRHIVSETVVLIDVNIEDVIDNFVETYPSNQIIITDGYLKTVEELNKNIKKD